ncbi:uncharacterized protein LOC120337735 isoform X1 [Styela clava]
MRFGVWIRIAFVIIAFVMATAMNRSVCAQIKEIFVSGLRILSPSLSKCNFLGGVCIRKYKDGKLLSQGDCEFHNGLDIANEIKLNIARKNCDVKYGGRCFKYVLHSTSDVVYEEAKLLCDEIGWTVANIYDDDHYKMIKQYLSSTMAPLRKIYLWTGMTFKRREVLQRSGEKIIVSSSIWYEGYPSTDSRYTGMAIEVDNDKNEKHQGVYNFPPDEPLYGALCEL